MDLSGFEDYLIRRHLSDTTRYATLLCIRKLLTEWAPLNLESFNKFVVWAFTQRAVRGAFKPMGTTGVNLYIRSLRHWGKYTGETWMNELVQYKEQERLKNELSNHEIERFLAAPPGPQMSEQDYLKWQLFFSLCIFSGLRMGEARKLEINQINIGGSRILLPPPKSKNRKPRSPSLTFNVIGQLEKYMPTLRGACLFPKKGALNSPMSSKAYELEFKRRIKLIGVVRDCVPYDLRHTAITHWLKKLRMPIYDVMKQVGHASPTTTEKYYQYGDQDEITHQLNQDPRIPENAAPEKEFAVIQQFVQARKLNPKDFVYLLTEDSIYVKMKH